MKTVLLIAQQISSKDSENFENATAKTVEVMVCSPGNLATTYRATFHGLDRAPLSEEQIIAAFFRQTPEGWIRLNDADRS